MQVDNDQGRTHGQSHAESNGEAKVSLHFLTLVRYGIIQFAWLLLHACVRGAVFKVCLKIPTHTCTCTCMHNHVPILYMWQIQTYKYM